MASDETSAQLAPSFLAEDWIAALYEACAAHHTVILQSGDLVELLDELQRFRKELGLKEASQQEGATR